MAKLNEQFEAAIAALEDQDVQAAELARNAAIEAGTDPDHAAIRYLDFMLEWLNGEELDDEEVMASLASAETLLEDAVGLDDPKLATRIVLDLADVLTSVGMVDEPEAALRSLCERDDLDLGARFDACALQVDIALDFHDDPELALELLDKVDASLHSQPAYVSLRAGTLLDLDRSDEAIASLEAALAETDDVNLRYQLAMTMRHTAESTTTPPAAIEHLLTVRARDLADHDIDPSAAIPRPQARDLQRYLEDVLETLPDPVIKRVGAVPIRVERWASEDAVRAGCDPRSTVVFEGRTDSDAGDDGQLDAIVIFHDALVVQIDDDDEIFELLTLGLVEEFDRFFGLELIPGM